MGGLRSRMRITFVTMAVATLAISGVPPFSGFFSKDEILWNAFAGPHAQPVLAVVGLVVAGLTAFYTGRLLFMTFFGDCRASHEVQHHIHESPAVMTGPLVVLACLAFAGGLLPIPAIVEPHTHEGHTPLWFMMLSTAAALNNRIRSSPRDR